MNSARIRTVAAVLIALLILLYVAVYAFSTVNDRASSFSSDGMTTEIAVYGEISETVQAQAFAIREEQVITQSYSGVLSYRIADGVRVSRGGIIADVYASENDAAAQNEIERLEREIARLELLSQPVDFFGSSSSLISSQIYTSLNSISAQVQGNNFSDLSTLKEDLQAALSRKQILAGEESAEDFAARKAELEAEKAQLELTAGDSITTVVSPAAGYFISGTDGFENVVAIDDVTNIMPAQVNDLLSREKGTGLASSVGKICTDFNWYLMCVFDDDEMIKFEEVTDVNLDIPFASTETIPAKLVAANRDPETGETAAVFECSYMDSDIASVRNETVQVNVNTYSGILVSEKALRFSDVTYTETDENGNKVTKVQENVKGVYVKYGGELEFVQVFTERSVNGYVVCKTELSDSELASLVTADTIQLYDEVVVEGTDLYDGKLVD